MIMMMMMMVIMTLLTKSFALPSGEVMQKIALLQLNCFGTFVPSQIKEEIPLGPKGTYACFRGKWYGQATPLLQQLTKKVVDFNNLGGFHTCLAFPQPC